MHIQIWEQGSFAESVYDGLERAFNERARELGYEDGDDLCRRNAALSDEEANAPKGGCKIADDYRDSAAYAAEEVCGDWECPDITVSFSAPRQRRERE